MFLVALAYLAFFSMALPDSMLGVAWPSMRGSFDQPVGMAGLDVTLNAYAARRFGPGRINLLHASYGVGAAVSPLIVTAVVVSGLSWRWAYAIIAALQFVVAAVFAATWRRWQDGRIDASIGTVARSSSVETTGSRGRSSVWSRATVLGVLTVAVQTGIESSVALWGYIFLTEAVGLTPAVAGGLASGYWLTMIVGRVGFGALAELTGSWRVMAVAVGLLLVAGGLVNLPGSGPAMVAVVLVGLAAAPLYPLLIVTTAERTSDEVADRVVGLQAAASSVGAAAIPALDPRPDLYALRRHAVSSRIPFRGEHGVGHGVEPAAGPVQGLGHRVGLAA